MYPDFPCPRRESRRSVANSTTERVRVTEEFCGAHRKFRSQNGRSPAAGKSSSVSPDTGGDTRQTLETWRAATLSLSLMRLRFTSTRSRES